jgi:hypothetical protein
MKRIGKAELISYNQVKRVLRRDLRDTSKIENLPSFPSEITVTQVGIHVAQDGIYRTMYGIPLGGRGHHPEKALIEDAVKWMSAGGLSNPYQSAQ